MSNTPFRLYQPNFGNDNIYTPELIDSQSFRAPLNAAETITKNAQPTEKVS